MAKIIKIKIVDFYSKLYNTIEEILTPEYEVEISDEPDILIYGPYGTGLEHYKYNNCIKICWCAEGVVPDFNECDYGIGSFPMTVCDNRYLRVPYYAPSEELVDRPLLGEEALSRKFCNFIYSNGNRGEGAILRKQFCKELMNYKHVDCPGTILHNMQGNISGRGEKEWMNSKIRFVSDYKFTISFENIKQYGMISEKILTAFQGNSLPIYWGAPDVDDVYSNNSFIDLSNSSSIQEMVEKVIEIDQDDALYLKMLNNNPVSDEFDWAWKKRRKEWFLNIIENGTRLNGDPLAYDSGINSSKKILSISNMPSYRLWYFIENINTRIKNRKSRK